MGKLRRNIFCRLLLLMCVAAQVAMFLPHHHHGRGEVVCFVASHCEGGDGKHSACTHDGHDHDRPQDECRISRIAITAPRIEQQYSTAFAPGQPAVLAGHVQVYTCTVCWEKRIAALSALSIYNSPYVEPLSTLLAVRTLPVRAPSV